MPSSIPLEIIFQIIQYLPPPPPYPIALPATDILTKTFLALCLTNTAIHPIATEYLYTHCVYINKPWRLTALLKSLSGFQTESHWTRSNPRVGMAWPVITSLVLEPYPDKTIASRPIAEEIDVLFTILSPTLTRLVIDMHLRSIYPEDDDKGVRPILRRAFQRLTSLEVFCSTRDELYLDLHGRITPQDYSPVWAGWPKLTTLALHNAPLDLTMTYFAEMVNIKTLVFEGADSYDDIPVHAFWNKAQGCTDYQICPTRPSTVAAMRGLMPEERHLELILANGYMHHRRPAEPMGTSKHLTTSLVHVPTPIGSEGHIEVCQEWLKELMISAKPLETVERMETQGLW